LRLEPDGFILCLGILAALALVLGVHDATAVSGRIGVTVVSILLLVFGVVEAIAARALILHRRSPDGAAPCRPVVFVGLLLLVVMGIYLFFAGLAGSGGQRLLVLLAAVALIGVGARGVRWSGGHGRITAVRIEAALALGALGVAAGAAQFWFQNQYVPAHAGRAVTLHVSLSRVGRQQGHEVIRATVAYRDVGGRSVTVIGSTYTLTGSRVVRCHRDATPARVQEVFGGFLVDPQTSRFMADVWEERPSTVLAAGKFVGDGKRLDPEVPAAREFVFFVPRGRYQLLRFRAQLFAIPSSVHLSKRALPKFANFEGDNELYAFWQIEDESWLHALMYGRERWVVIRYELVDPSRKATGTLSNALRATARFPDPQWRRATPTAALVDRLFDRSEPSEASEPFADAELAVEQVARPGSRDPAACTAAP
jgi:hypothetical protein